MEPLSIIAISAAVGGVAGKFVDRAWNYSEKWLSNYFKDHAPKAREHAEQNSLDFLAQLAQRVKALEEQGTKYKTTINDSLNHPDFSVLLQKAIISSAQTNDKQKHELLARLVSDRLTKGSESLFAITSKLACDAVSMLNMRQMKILGLLTNIMMVRPHPFPPPEIPKEIFNIWFVHWLKERLNVYQDLTFAYMDLLHLESLSCVRVSIGSRDLQKTLSPPKESDLTFDYKAFLATEWGRKVKELWESDLKHALPTTVGQVIGIYVSDMLTNTTTSFDGWGELTSQISV